MKEYPTTSFPLPKLGILMWLLMMLKSGMR